MSVHASFETALGIPAHGERRNGNNGNLRPFPHRGIWICCQGADGSGRGQAVHDGHVYVHQHQVEIALVRGMECGFAIAHFLHRVAISPEAHRCQQPAGRIVLGQQDAQRPCRF